jgi:gamma-glutamyltranspeptidase/glutathione hydrolase
MSTSPRPRIDSELQELGRPEYRWRRKVAVSAGGMVSTQHYLATQAGAEMLAAGGNAIDAAVAAALALGVCEPTASGLGGQTMMLIHLTEKAKTIALDGSSRAPMRALPDTLSADDCRRGYKACTVPSTPRVLAYARRRYGKLKWREVIAPAIRLAEDGYAVSELQEALTRRERRCLRESTAADLFLKDGKKRYRRGDIFKQPILANTLKHLARRGGTSFYRGSIAETIEHDMVFHGGLIRRDDLAQMHPPIERRPVSCRFENLRVVSFPPPGAGRTLIEMLNITGHFPAHQRTLDSPAGAVLLARIMQQAYRDRRDRPFDPNYYAQVSNKRMLSLKYATSVYESIRSSGETTHLSVMDRWGNVVGLTQSIERVYGACVANPELGFLYNNYMMAFEREDYHHPYYLRPRAVPWASVAPTIVFRGRKPWLVIGSPGSERITSTIFQIILRLARMEPFAAVDAPRMHCSYDGKVSLEAARLRDDIPRALERAGFTVDVRDPYSFYLGCVQMVMREGDHFIGVADPRRDGAAGGPPA